MPAQFSRRHAVKLPLASATLWPVEKFNLMLAS
jgi:hypothetical protein